jgi:creatinine amidohydrolase
MSQHHLGFTGSVRLRPSTLIAVLSDVIHPLLRHGLERLLSINGRVGNVAIVTAAFDENTPVSLRGDTSPVRCTMELWPAGPRCEALLEELYGDANGSHATAAEVALAQFYLPHAIKHAQISPKIAPPSKGFFDSTDYRHRFPDGRIGSDPSLSSPDHGIRLYAAAVEDTIELYPSFCTAD